MSKFEVTDEILYESCKNVEKHLLNQLPDEKDLNYSFSNRFQRKMKKLIKYESRSKLVNTVYKYSKKVAVILVITTIGLFTITMSVEALRSQLFEVVREVYDKFTSYIFTTDINYSEEEFDILLPKYLPEGFEEIDRKESFQEMIIVYKNNYGEEVTYHYFSIINGEVSIDTEDIKSEKIIVNDLEANYIEKGSLSKLTWHDDKYFYGISIFSNENSKIVDKKKELISISESIR